MAAHNPLWQCHNRSLIEKLREKKKKKGKKK